MRQLIDRFLHKTLGRPYYLAKTIDQGHSEAPPVVLLHGIGRTGAVWRHVVRMLTYIGVRVIGFDLLGFGESPKPTWLFYNADDHARAVIASIEKLKLKRRIVLVGHSMGCLVAVRVAHLRPDLVMHLVLYEMPLYDGLPEKRRYRLRTNMYLKLYKKITEFQPSFTDTNQRLTEKLGTRIVGLEVTPKTWLPFIRSLENTIMKQTTAADIKDLDMPMDVIYGRFDMLVIRGEAKHFFGEKADSISTYTVRARHEISTRASRFIVVRIEAALKAAETAKALAQEEKVSE